MEILTLKQFIDNQKIVLDKIDKDEQVIFKHEKKYINLIVSKSPNTKFVDEEWIKEFMSIPMEYRYNPFEYSPSGDLFYADIRNLKHIAKASKGK